MFSPSGERSRLCLSCLCFPPERSRLRLSCLCSPPERIRLWLSCLCSPRQVNVADFGYPCLCSPPERSRLRLSCLCSSPERSRLWLSCLCHLVFMLPRFCLIIWLSKKTMLFVPTQIFPVAAKNHCLGWSIPPSFF